MAWPQENASGGKKVFDLAVYWVSERNIDLVVMVVSPDHAGFYISMGAKVIAKSYHTPGLKGAVSVLLALDVKKSKRIQKIWLAELQRRLANTQGVLKGDHLTA